MQEFDTIIKMLFQVYIVFGFKNVQIPVNFLSENEFIDSIFNWILNKPVIPNIHKNLNTNYKLRLRLKTPFSTL